ncbi:MAG: hypothetical protein ABFC71_09620 [Methanoregula sp.]
MRISLSPEEFKELLLSHHPNLPCFKDDVIILFDRRICAGCLLGYPTALLVLLLLKPSGFESIFFSLVFAILSQFRRLSKNILIQHFGRVVAGVALGFGIGGLYWAFINGKWLAILILMSGAGVYLFLRFYSIKSKFNKECNKVL